MAMANDLAHLELGPNPHTLLQTRPKRIAFSIGGTVQYTGENLFRLTTEAGGRIMLLNMPSSV